MMNPLLTHARQYNTLLLRVFPSLKKINGEYVNEDYKAPPRRSLSSQKPASTLSPAFSKLNALLQCLQSYRSFNTKQLFQKILITFAGTTPLMKLQKSLLPHTLVDRLLKTPPKELTEAYARFKLLRDDLFSQNLMEVSKLRSATATITNYIVSKRVKQRALLNRMLKKESLMLRLQAAIRGHLCRLRNKQKVDKIRRDALKGTTKYKAAMKIQSAFRGFTFRLKRKRALAKLGSKTGQGGEDPADLDLLGEDDFDAEAFLGVKQENLEKVDIFSGANASLMEKYIQVLSFEQKQK